MYSIFVITQCNVINLKDRDFSSFASLLFLIPNVYICIFIIKWVSYVCLHWLSWLSASKWTKKKRRRREWKKKHRKLDKISGVSLTITITEKPWIPQSVCFITTTTTLYRLVYICVQLKSKKQINLIFYLAFHKEKILFVYIFSF